MSINSSSWLSTQVRKYGTLILFTLSASVCGWAYFSTDYKQEQLLTAHEWQSTTFSRIAPDALDAFGPLRRVKETCNVVYLPNHTYSRITMIELYSEQSTPLTMHIAESGYWDISGGYLMTDPAEFKDVISGTNTSFNDEQLHLVKDFFRMNAQESRRIDVLDSKTLLLTNLTYGSTLLSSL